jgi:hypothetical protein
MPRLVQPLIPVFTLNAMLDCLPLPDLHGDGDAHRAICVLVAGG